MKSLPDLQEIQESEFEGKKEQQLKIKFLKKEEQEELKMLKIQLKKMPKKWGAKMKEFYEMMRNRLEKMDVVFLLKIQD